MSVDFRPATLEDVPLLAEMNQQLIIDEGSRNSMNGDELQGRMRRWLEGDYRAVLIFKEADMVGYLLYRVSVDEYFPYQASIYVRQFFIKRTYRRRGIGQVAFESLAKSYFPPDSAITLDVLETNSEAKQFWLKLGFDVYCTTLRRESKA
jgi:ribosomal protein S18 acetylase RimI-like enzyme